VPHNIRDSIVDFVQYWSNRAGIKIYKFIRWLDIYASKFYEWKRRYGMINVHNSWIPRGFWLEELEKLSIIEFYLQHPYEGYRRLTFIW